MENYTLEDQLMSKMSGLFLTEEIPVSIITADDDVYFELIDEFIREHVVDVYEWWETGQLLELIEDAVSIAIRYHNSKA